MMMKEKEKRLSNAVKPEGMDAAEGLRGLSRQFAAREVPSISTNGPVEADGVVDARKRESAAFFSAR